MTSKLTRDIIQSEIADFFAGVVEIHTELGGPNTVEEAQNQLTERVLACVPAVDSEPVAWKVRFKLEGQPGSNFNKFFENRRAMNDVVSLHELGGFNIDVTPLYRHAQPAPVVPTFDEWLEIRGSKPLGWVKDAMRESYDACRAAMLQAGTLTNEDTKQAWTGIPDIDNAINMLDRIDTLESCDDDRIEAVKTVLRRLAGNSPVIPDGYVMVPREPTAEMIWAAKYVMSSTVGWASFKEAYIAMLAAAPQEVK